jgi:hypothetical protein
MTDEEFVAELKKRTEKERYATGCFKGLPEDKHYEELNIAGFVLEYLRQPAASRKSEPHGPDTAPDVAVVLQTGERIGLEITELVDGALRREHASHRAAEGTYREWTEKEIAAELGLLIKRKDTDAHLRNHAPDYDAIWLAVFIGEQHINDFPGLVPKAIAHLTYRPALISRVFVVLDYLPGRSDSGYPVIEVLG